MEKAKLKYKTLKKKLKEDPNNEKLQKKVNKAKEKYKKLKNKTEDEKKDDDNKNNINKSTNDINKSADVNELKRKQIDDADKTEHNTLDNTDNIDDVDDNNNKDNEKEKQPKAKKKRRRKRKNIPNFVPWRKLIASTVENGGPKGLTRSALRNAIVLKDGKEDPRLAEEYDFQLDKILNQGKLVCLDGNKIKLIKLLDERAKVRILEEIKQRKIEKDKKRRVEEKEYYNSIGY